MHPGKQKMALKVRDVHDFVRSIGFDIIEAFLRGSGSLEETETSKRCALFRRNDDTIATRIEVDAQWHPPGTCELETPHGSNQSRECLATAQS